MNPIFTGAGVLQGIECRTITFTMENADSPNREKRQSPGRQRRRGGIELTVLKQDLDDFAPQQNQSYGCGNCNERMSLVAKFKVVFSSVICRKAACRDRSGRMTSKSRRHTRPDQFHHPIGN